MNSSGRNLSSPNTSIKNLDEDHLKIGYEGELLKNIRESNNEEDIDLYGKDLKKLTGVEPSKYSAYNPFKYFSSGKRDYHAIQKKYSKERISYLYSKALSDMDKDSMEKLKIINDVINNKSLDYDGLVKVARIVDNMYRSSGIMPLKHAVGSKELFELVGIDNENTSRMDFNLDNINYIFENEREERRKYNMKRYGVRDGSVTPNNLLNVYLDAVRGVSSSALEIGDTVKNILNLCVYGAGKAYGIDDITKYSNIVSKFSFSKAIMPKNSDVADFSRKTADVAGHMMFMKHITGLKPSTFSSLSELSKFISSGKLSMMGGALSFIYASRLFGNIVDKTDLEDVTKNGLKSAFSLGSVVLINRISSMNARKSAEKYSKDYNVTSYSQEEGFRANVINDNNGNINSPGGNDVINVQNESQFGNEYNFNERDAGIVPKGTYSSKDVSKQSAYSADTADISTGSSGIYKRVATGRGGYEDGKVEYAWESGDGGKYNEKLSAKEVFGDYKNNAPEEIREILSKNAYFDYNNPTTIKKSLDNITMVNNIIPEYFEVFANDIKDFNDPLEGYFEESVGNDIIHMLSSDVVSIDNANRGQNAFTYMGIHEKSPLDLGVLINDYDAKVAYYSINEMARRKLVDAQEYNKAIDNKIVKYMGNTFRKFAFGFSDKLIEQLENNDVTYDNQLVDAVEGAIALNKSLIKLEYSEDFNKFYEINNKFDGNTPKFRELMNWVIDGFEEAINNKSFYKTFGDIGKGEFVTNAGEIIGPGIVAIKNLLHGLDIRGNKIPIHRALIKIKNMLSKGGARFKYSNKPTDEDFSGNSSDHALLSSLVKDRALKALDYIDRHMLSKEEYIEYGKVKNSYRQDIEENARHSVKYNESKGGMKIINDVKMFAKMLNRQEKHRDIALEKIHKDKKSSLFIGNQYYSRDMNLGQSETYTDRAKGLIFEKVFANEFKSDKLFSSFSSDRKAKGSQLTFLKSILSKEEYSLFNELSESTALRESAMNRAKSKELTSSKYGEMYKLIHDFGEGKISKITFKAAAKKISSSFEAFSSIASYIINVSKALFDKNKKVSAIELIKYLNKKLRMTPVLSASLALIDDFKRSLPKLMDIRNEAIKEKNGPLNGKD